MKESNSQRRKAAVVKADEDKQGRGGFDIAYPPIAWCDMEIIPLPSSAKDDDKHTLRVQLIVPLEKINITIALEEEKEKS